MTGAALVVFSGLPGTGKTSISVPLAARLGAAHLRIDIIEQALRDAGTALAGPEGYAVAQALADANLRLGLHVVADCVNPVPESRQGWRDAAARAGAVLVDIHLVCSDAALHRARIETRIADIPGLAQPDWDAVTARRFAPRDDAPLVIDTALVTIGAAVDRCHGHVLACLGAA